MAALSNTTDDQFKAGDRVLVLGRYRGHPQYTDDVVIEFNAHQSVTMPSSYICSDDVINLDKLRLPGQSIKDVFECIKNTLVPQNHESGLKLTEEEINHLYKFIIRQTKKFDPSKGTLEFFMKCNIYWWFKELENGRLHGGDKA